MAERFEKLYVLPSDLYSEGSPVIISAGSLLKDTETGKVIAQIKYHSISSMPIKALKIRVTAYDISGVELEGVDEYQYLDLNVRQGQDFGANKAIVLPNIVTRSFGITSVEVIFSNGISQSVTMPMKALPQSEYLSSLLRNDELVKQYQIETSKDALYIPQKASNLWCCSCGEWNSNGSCTRCGVDFSVANKYLDASLLEPKMAERIIKEKQAREQQQQAAIEQEKIAKENQKRKKRKTTILVIVAVLVVGIISGLLYYNSQHKYDEIAGIYALQNLDDAEEALYKYQKDTIDEYGFNPYSYEIDIRGSGKVYGLWFVNDRGSMTPRAATVKSVSADGVVEFDVLDYPDAKVTMTINIETGEATYTSKGLTLKYQRISEELANNGYKNCSTEQVRDEISFVKDLFDLKTIEAICKKHPNATTNGTEYDLKIEGSFCGANGTYEIALDDEWKIYFSQGIYDINTEKQALIDNFDSVFGENSYSEYLDAYSWESNEYNLQINYYPHKGIYFFLDTTMGDSLSEPDYDDEEPSPDTDDTIVETFISNGCFTFTPRSFVMRFDDVDKNTSQYNYTYMRMNGESSLFYELAEISGGYSNVRSVGMISFVKNLDTTLSIEEDFTENIVTKINVLVESADDVPPILVSCMCAADPSLDFTTAFNLGMDVAEKAGTTEGYTHNGINYVIFADVEYYYIVISIANGEEDQKTQCDILGHSWVDASCTVPMTCSRCYQTSGNALGHDWGNPTCTTPRSCCVCFEVDPYSEPLGHSFVGGECMICGADDPEYNPYTLTSTTYSITLMDDSDVAYITMIGGYTIVYEIDDSSIVSCEWGEWDGDIIPLTFTPVSVGKTFVTVYIEDSNVSIKINVTVNEHSHKYTSTAIINPTCTEQGYTIYTCECGDAYNADYIEAADHTEVIDKEVDPTCTETGLTEGKHCSVCNEVLVAQEELPALGHTEVIDKEVDSTCIETGLTEGSHCSVCGEIIIAQEIINNHHFENGSCKECGATQGLKYTLSGDGYSVSVGTATNVTSIVIPSHYNGLPVTSIYYGAFWDCHSLETIIIPNTVTSIGANAFVDCDSLTSITIPNSVTSIGGSAFWQCDSLKSVVLGNGLTSIGVQIFSDCDSLENIIIPNSITSIGKSAFIFCRALENVYYTGTQEEWNSIAIDSSNDSYLTNATIHYNYVLEN